MSLPRVAFIRPSPLMDLSNEIFTNESDMAH